MKTLKRNKKLGKFIAFLILFVTYPLIFIISHAILSFVLVETENPNTIGEIRPLIKLNSSIMFYTRLSDKYVKVPDYRTRFWELQLKDFTAKYERIYISEEKEYINGVEMKVLQSKGDSAFCRRFYEIMNDFIYKHEKMKWFFFSEMHTFVNVSNLANHIKSIEKHQNPMSQVILSYGTAYSKEAFPSTSSGILISNFAIRNFLSNDFVSTCKKNGLDKGIGELVKQLGIDIDRFKDSAFVSAFPTDNKVSDEDVAKMKKCNSEGTYVYKLVTMNFVDKGLEESLNLLNKMSPSVKIEENNKVFNYCKQRNSK